MLSGIGQFNLRRQLVIPRHHALGEQIIDIASMRLQCLHMTGAYLKRAFSA